MIYCDTSTLAKYYVTELESAAVRRALDTADAVASSELARVELMAVFHRRLREHKWDHSTFLAVVRQFSKDDAAGYWIWLRISQDVLEQSVQTFTTLPREIFLRSSDCVHLLTAAHHGFSGIHTHDGHQAQAAPTIGLSAVLLQ